MKKKIQNNIFSIKGRGYREIRSFSRKGQDERFWVYLNLAIVLVVLTTLISPLYRSIELAQVNNANLQAQDIAGAINMMSASPAIKMTYSKGLPRSCSILVTGDIVRFTIDPNSEKPSVGVANILQSRVTVQTTTTEIQCSRDKRSIDIVKEGSRIEVR